MKRLLLSLMIGLAVNNAMAGCSSLNLGMNQTCPTNQSDTWNYNNTKLEDIGFRVVRALTP